MGETIRTLTGRPNRILEVREDHVLVGTDRSPDGQLVPIEWVQNAMDLLSRDGDVMINVDTVGHRSAFVGAVLATLPGVRTETNPRRVVMEAGSPITERPWREPPEVQDALDAIVELAGRGPARRAGRRQSAAERRAIELRAVEMATAYFQRLGWDVEYVGGVASYDLDCSQGDRSLHVEVKGTTSTGTRVLLTRNEVNHAKAVEAEVALYVLSRIGLSLDSEDKSASKRWRRTYLVSHGSWRMPRCNRLALSTHCRSPDKRNPHSVMPHV